MRSLASPHISVIGLWSLIMLVIREAKWQE